MSSSNLSDVSHQDGASIWVVIPASGVGSRMQSDVPKQYLTLNGLTVMEQTLLKINAITPLAGIVLVVSKTDEYYKKLPLDTYPHLHIVEGGATRADSVLNGLTFIQNYITQPHILKQPHTDQPTAYPQEKAWVLVHDCARPCVDIASIHMLMNTCLAQDAGGILAEKIADTVKESTTDTHIHNDTDTDACYSPRVISTKDRSALWLAQTPQFFKLTSLIHAIKRGLEQGLPITDEASAIEQQGGDVLLISSPKTNIKITQPADLALARAILSIE